MSGKESKNELHKNQEREWFCLKSSLEETLQKTM